MKQKTATAPKSEKLAALSDSFVSDKKGHTIFTATIWQNRRNDSKFLAIAKHNEKTGHEKFTYLNLNEWRVLYSKEGVCTAAIADYLNKKKGSDIAVQPH